MHYNYKTTKNYRIYSVLRSHEDKNSRVTVICFQTSEEYAIEIAAATYTKCVDLLIYWMMIHKFSFPLVLSKKNT